MRRYAIALMALFTVLTPLASSLAQEGAKGPRAIPLEPIKDFKVVAKGEVLHHVFEIKNEGDTTLELTDVKPSCGCTVVEFDKEIAPGKVGRIKSSVETINFTGPIAKSIAVFTNDTQSPKLQLVVKAEVKAFLAARPGYARYIYVQGERVEPIPQLIWSQDGGDLEILDIKSPLDYLTVSHRAATDEERNQDFPGKQWIVDVLLKQDAPVGALRDYVEVVTNHPKQKVIDIPLSGFVRPRQHVTPQELDMGVLDGESLPVNRTLTFTSFIEKGIEVTQIDTSGLKGLTAVAKPTGRETGHRFEVVLTLGPEAPKGEINGVIKLHITDEKNPVVEVPVKGKVL